MTCTTCGREIGKGELFFQERWRVLRANEGIMYTLVDGPYIANYCKEHTPGHILRASLGITQIRGAASLTGRGK